VSNSGLRGRQEATRGPIKAEGISVRHSPKGLSRYDAYAHLFRSARQWVEASSQDVTFWARFAILRGGVRRI